jgi:hypothetical protein
MVSLLAGALHFVIHEVSVSHLAWRFPYIALAPQVRTATPHFLRHALCSTIPGFRNDPVFSATCVSDLARIGRWLAFCNPELSDLITKKLGTDEWTLDMSKLRGLEEHASDPEFRAQWRAVKQEKKKQLAALIKDMTGDDVNTDAMFDIHVRPILAR